MHFFWPSSSFNYLVDIPLTQTLNQPQKKKSKSTATILENLHKNEELFVLGFVVERKTAEDLAKSIIDGRYAEQKVRLKKSGLSKVTYLVEGSLSGQDVLPTKSLRTAMASTLIQHGFSVQRCANLDESVRWLARTHHQVARQLGYAVAAAQSGDPLDRCHILL